MGQILKRCKANDITIDSDNPTEPNTMALRLLPNLVLSAPFWMKVQSSWT